MALVGNTGCGKSGVASFVFGRLGNDFAPIHAPVFYETAETVKEPGAFARYLLQKLLAAAEPFAAVSRREREQRLRRGE